MNAYSALACGGEPKHAVPGAVAVELVHNFSLVHDDVMDGDATRRHRPTAWAVFGVPAAILAGDAMLTVAVDVPVTPVGQPSTATAQVRCAVRWADLALPGLPGRHDVSAVFTSSIDRYRERP